MRHITVLKVFSFFALLHSTSAFSEETLLIDTFQQKNMNSSALNEWLSSNQCELTITSNNEANSAQHFIFSVFTPNTAPSGKTILLIGKNRGKHPLKAAWLVHKSTGINRLHSLKNERAAVQANKSLIGYIEPMQQMHRAGVKTSDLKLYPTASYEGAIALLLHGDVTTAAIPLPLAIPWAKANNLSVISDGDIRYQSAIWSENGNQLNPACHKALLTIKKDNRRDKKMAVFPEWLEGFAQP